MATVQKLQEEASCPVCLEYFTDPVSIHCGHNFCRACIARCWVEAAAGFSCPQCRETAPRRDLRCSRELASLVELVKQLALPAKPEEQSQCEIHGEPLKHFCLEEQQVIYVGCRESGAPTVVPTEEAAQTYKAQIKARLQALKAEREKLLRLTETGKKICWEYLEKIERERQSIGAEFQHFRQFLAEQEHLLLARLEGLAAMTRRRKDTVARFPAEISRLNTLISELERACRLPGREFPQGIGITLSRGEAFLPPPGMSPELEKRLGDFSQQSVALKEALRQFRETLARGLEIGVGRSPAWGADTVGRKADVTLDPATAHPQLVLSVDGRGVQRGPAPQDLPDNPERFDAVLAVLGREGFRGGRRSWEVEVGVGGVWAVGVARESVRRKGRMSHSPAQEIWAVGRWGGCYRAYAPSETVLPLPGVPRRVRVTLDYDAGRVAFFDVGNRGPIFVFPPAAFDGERVFPFFLAGCPLRLCP